MCLVAALGILVGAQLDRVWEIVSADRVNVRFYTLERLSEGLECHEVL